MWLLFHLGDMDTSSTKRSIEVTSDNQTLLQLSTNALGSKNIMWAYTGFGCQDVMAEFSSKVSLYVDKKTRANPGNPVARTGFMYCTRAIVCNMWKSRVLAPCLILSPGVSTKIY